MQKAPDITVRHARRKLFFIGLALVTTIACADQNDTFYRSFEAGEPAPIARNAQDAFTVHVDGGPSADDAYSAKPGVGFSGLRSLHYRGDVGGKQEAAVFDVDLPVQANTQLSYLLFPCAAK